MTPVIRCRSSIDHSSIALAGHGDVCSDDTKNYILKRLPDRSELNFYTDLIIPSKLSRYIPKFYGCYQETSPDVFTEEGYSSNAASYLVLDNVARGMRRVNILEVKMGTVQHCADAVPSKVASSLSKCRSTTSAALGFRVNGTYRTGPGGEVIKTDKHHGRGLTAEDLPGVFATFFSDASPAQLDDIRARLKGLQDVTRDRPGIRLISSSLLISYDGGEGDLARVGMIDFAHVEQVSGVDEGYLTGLTSLVALIK